MSEVYNIIKTDDGQELILYKVRCTCGKQFLSLNTEDNACFECDIFEGSLPQ